MQRCRRPRLSLVSPRFISPPSTYSSVFDLPDTPLNNLTPRDFARLLVQAQPRLTLYIRSLVFNKTDVDDLVQDVAAKAYERLETYDPDRPFEAWLITLARYEVLTYFKSRKRDRLVFDENVAEKVADTMQTMSDRNELFTLELLERCLARIRPDDRELLRQRFDLNKTGEAIAEALKVSGATVSRRLAKLYGTLLVCVKSTMRQEGS